MVSEQPPLREWLIELCQNDGLHQAEARIVADFVVSHPEINSGKIESESRLKELIKQELEKTSLCSVSPSEEEFNSIIPQFVASDLQLFAEEPLETVEMALVEYRNDFIEGEIDPDSENHPPIEIKSSKAQGVEVLPGPYAQEAVPMFATKLGEIDWDQNPEESKKEARNSTNESLTDHIPTTEHHTTESSQMLHKVMKKQTLVHLHGLLAEIGDYLKENGEMSDDWPPDKYEQLDVLQTSLHHPPEKHAKAVNLLASGITGELIDSGEVEASESMTVDDT